ARAEVHVQNEDLRRIDAACVEQVEHIVSDDHVVVGAARRFTEADEARALGHRAHARVPPGRVAAGEAIDHVHLETELAEQVDVPLVAIEGQDAGVPSSDHSSSTISLSGSRARATLSSMSASE